MNRIDDIFTIHTARSVSFGDHDAGLIPFVTNGLTNNGVLGLVAADPKDKVFRFDGICVSAFAEATPHLGPFIARGNGGSGLVVLEPKTPVSHQRLIQMAAFVNAQVRWRFNWYRQISATRLGAVAIPNEMPELAGTSDDLIPEPLGRSRGEWNLNLRTYHLHDIFDLRPGRFHALNQLESGGTPVISCGGNDNGIAGYYSVESQYIHRDKLTIALNGSPLLTLWHPYSFAGKDDVAICTPITPLRVSTLLFIQMMMNRERWRYSYYRKCYMGKLRRFCIRLPSARDCIDEETIASVVEASPYWNYVTQWADVSNG